MALAMSKDERLLRALLSALTNDVEISSWKEEKNMLSGILCYKLFWPVQKRDNTLFLLCLQVEPTLRISLFVVDEGFYDYHNFIGSGGIPLEDLHVSTVEQINSLIAKVKAKEASVIEKALDSYQAYRLFTR